MTKKYDEIKKLVTDVDNLTKDLEKFKNYKKSLDKNAASFWYQSHLYESKIGSTTHRDVPIDIKELDPQLFDIFYEELKKTLDVKISETKKEIENLQQQCE
ncbi:MAG: hypothetical protein PHX86_08170 [Caldisericia bacterium]|nr:hypothetical protein [Caldisericia bacterium]